MDALYDVLFQHGDEDDAMYHKIIPGLNCQIFRQVLECDIDIINNSYLSMEKWAKFKIKLLNYEAKWGITVWKWKINLDNEACPYKGIDIDWEQLNKQSTRYFQVHMAFEDVWFGPSLCNVWEPINDEIGFEV